jgi:hypothetical protein
MPYAYVTTEGNIRLVVNKVSPFERLQEGERLVGYNPPEYDESFYFIKATIPVVGDDTSFEVLLREDSLDKAKDLKQKLVQSHLDSKAKEYGYDNILSAVSYAYDQDCPYYSEGLAFSQWRSACWRTCFAVLNECTTFDQVPSDEAFLQSLPLLNL